jgi:hypothetical protein
MRKAVVEAIDEQAPPAVLAPSAVPAARAPAIPVLAPATAFQARATAPVLEPAPVPAPGPAPGLELRDATIGKLFGVEAAGAALGGSVVPAAPGMPVITVGDAR